MPSTTRKKATKKKSSKRGNVNIKSNYQKTKVIVNIKGEKGTKKEESPRYVPTGSHYYNTTYIPQTLDPSNKIGSLLDSIQPILAKTNETNRNIVDLFNHHNTITPLERVRKETPITSQNEILEAPASEAHETTSVGEPESQSETYIFPKNANYILPQGKVWNFKTGRTVKYENASDETIDLNKNYFSNSWLNK
jgi:hypothetical protein